MGNVVDFNSKKKEKEQKPNEIDYINYTMEVTSAHDKDAYYGCDVFITLSDVNGNSIEMSQEQMYRMLTLDTEHILECISKAAEEGEDGED